MKSPLKYPLDYYSVSAIDIAETLSEKEVRREYIRLSGIARKRLSAIGRSKFRGTETYTQNIGQYPLISELGSQKEVELHLSRVARFLSGKLSSLTALRKYENESIDTLHRRGYTFVNKSNFTDFAKYMETMAGEAASKQYGSVRIAELYGEALKKKISPDQLFKDFGFWYENYEKLKEMPKLKGSGVNAEDYRRAIENGGKKSTGSRGKDNRQVRRIKEKSRKSRRGKGN